MYFVINTTDSIRIKSAINMMHNYQMNPRIGIISTIGAMGSKAQHETN